MSCALPRFHFCCAASQDFLAFEKQRLLHLSRLGIAIISAGPETPGVVTMGHTASWTFATMLAFGFVAAILLGML
jgi:hypothetical protein